MKTRRPHSNRGRHKRRLSPETQRWEREHLLPELPGWMDRSTYRELARLRETIHEQAASS